MTPPKPDILEGWAAFKEFCQVQFHRTTEGFIFHSGFKVNFPPLDHDRVFDYSIYEVAFTRYWYEKGDVSNTAHVAESGFKVGDHPALRNHEWVDLEIDAGEGDATQQQTSFEKYVKEVEAVADLWDALSKAKPSGMESYCGPQ